MDKLIIKVLLCRVAQKSTVNNSTCGGIVCDTASECLEMTKLQKRLDSQIPTVLIHHNYSPSVSTSYAALTAFNPATLDLATSRPCNLETIEVVLYARD